MKKSNKLFIGLTLVNLCFSTVCVVTFKILITKDVSIGVHIFIGLMELFMFFHLNCWFLFLSLPLKNFNQPIEKPDDWRQTLDELKARVTRNAHSVEKMNMIMQGKQLVNFPENIKDILSSVQAVFDSTLSVIETIETGLDTDKTCQNV